MEAGPQPDTRRPSSIKTYAVLRLSPGGACGQSFRLTTTWMIGGGRIDMSTLRAVPLARAMIPTPGARSLAVASRGTVGAPGKPPMETGRAQRRMA
jgi:hypothetical protein